MESEEDDNEWYEFLSITVSAISAHPEISFLDSVAFALGPVVYRYYKHWKTTVIGSSSSYDEKIRYVLEFWRSTQLTQSVDVLSKIFDDLLKDLPTASYLREKIHQRFIADLLPFKDLQSLDSYVLDKIMCPLCDKTFQSKDILDIHAIRVHKVTKPKLDHLLQALSYNISNDRAIIEDILRKMESKTWKETLGKTVLQTLSIRKFYENWNSWNLILGGSIAIVSSMLNLQPTTDELSKYVHQIALHPEFKFSCQLGENIMQLFSEIKYFPSYANELLDDVIVVREKSQSIFAAFSRCINDNVTTISGSRYPAKFMKGMERNKDTPGGIEFSKLDDIYDGISIIDSMFDTILENSEDLHKICNGIEFRNLWFSLNANPVTKTGFNDENIHMWLASSTSDLKFESKKCVAQKYLYILLVRAKFLLIHLIFHVFTSNNNCHDIGKSVLKHLKKFNSSHFDVVRVYESVSESVYIPNENIDEQIQTFLNTFRKMTNDISRKPERKASYPFVNYF